MSKSIEEIIAELEQMATDFDRVAADVMYHVSQKTEAAAKAHVLRSAIEKLETNPDNQPNEPLTEEELRGMVGEWVWVTVHYNHCDCSGWALICTGATLGYLGQMLSIKDCGTKFDAHRRPPEGAT